MKKMLRFLLSALCVLFLTQSAFALGLGFYGTAGVGWNKWYEDEGNVSGGTYNVGGGLMLDTCLAMNRVFNYRLNVGVEFLGTPNIPYNWTRVHVVNTFGFGVVRTRSVRFWLGPEVIFGPFFGSNRVGVTVGTGLAFGLNVNIGSTVTLAFSLSGRFEGGYREYSVTKVLKEDQLMYLRLGPAASYLLLPDEYRMTASGFTAYGQFSIAIMFRISDTYGR